MGLTHLSITTMPLNRVPIMRPATSDPVTVRTCHIILEAVLTLHTSCRPFDKLPRVESSDLINACT